MRWLSIADRSLLASFVATSITTMRKAFDTTLAKLKSSSGPQSLAFIGLQNALELLKEVAGKSGVPGLQEGIKGFVVLLDAIQVCGSSRLPCRRIAC